MSGSRTPLVRLGYLAFIQSGITVDGNRADSLDDVTLPYLRVANVQDGHLDLGTITEIRVPKSLARSATLKRGDVLMTEGGDLDKLGRGTVWDDEIESCLHQNHVFAVRPDPSKLLPEYLALVTQSSYARAYFESTGIKTTNLASTSNSKIRDFKIPLVDLDMQRRIADFLDAETARIDALLDARRSQLDLFVQRRFALTRDLLQSGVTGGSPQKTSIGWLPQCPADWTLKKLRYVTQCLDGARIPLSAEERATRKGEFPYYGASRIVDYVDDYLFDEELVLLGEDGAQLGNPNYEIASVVNGKIWVNNHAHVLRSQGISAPLLAAILNVFDRELCMSGSTREKITQDAMNSLIIPVPSATEQLEIERVLTERRMAQERIEREIRKQINLLAERRQALITAAVTGEITV